MLITFLPSCLLLLTILKFLNLCRFACETRLQCEPSGEKPSSNSSWSTCPAVRCGGTNNLNLGDVATSTTCNKTFCAYAGYTKDTIFTTLSTESTCPAGWCKLLALFSALILYVLDSGWPKIASISNFHLKYRESRLIFYLMDLIMYGLHII